MAYKLTSLGESRAGRIDQVRDREDAIITLLYEQKDALEVEEIAGEAHMTEDQAQRILTRLASGESKYVKEV